MSIPQHVAKVLDAIESDYKNSECRGYEEVWTTVTLMKRAHKLLTDAYIEEPVGDLTYAGQLGDRRSKINDIGSPTPYRS